ncbi:MAG: hypothetical protein JWQ57_297 [Mucilaginibacter sp.]|nr:hypothetical protein [Mucilaginibacter sp.]
MKNSLKQYLLVMVAVVLLAACKKGGVYNFSCKVDGADYKADLVGNYNPSQFFDSAQLGMYILSINAFDPNFQQGRLVLTLMQRTGTQAGTVMPLSMYRDTTTASCDTTGCLFASIGYTPNFNTAPFMLADTTGQVVLTGFDAVNKTASGTFAASFRNGRVISGGTFTNVPFVTR